MYLPLLWQVVLAAWVVSATTPTPTISKRQDAPTRFVTTQDGQFMFNGSNLDFVGTNAYWLAALNSDEDIDFTLGNMSANGVRVVRTWAFNDVESIPENGTWFQLIANGTTTINNGTNGLQKLDTIVRLAEKHKLFVLPSLTNNWNPRPLFDNSTLGLSVSARDITPGTNNTLSRNTLSNDYGGMDVYVRQFRGKTSTHDEFYQNPTILNAFLNYTTQIVSRYVDSPAIFGWELANDPRCNSSIPANKNCTALVITDWLSKVATHVKSIDPNHLISSGSQGFLCTGCPKRFPRIPPPQTSATPNRRRGVTPKPLTKRKILEDRKAAFKRTRNAKKRDSAGGIRIRGRWMATETRRQANQDLGPAFDGSQGVDSEDILNIPQIGFGTFQLFPDQNVYGPDDPNLPAFNNTVNQGNQWIKTQAALGALLNKPVSLNGFGLVTQANAPFFVPFNTSQAPFGADAAAPPTPTQQAFGVTDAQRDDAYTQWLQTGLQSGVQGMLQYQWSQGNLTTGVGTAITPTVTGTGTSPTVSGIGVSPNDGYGIQGAGQQQVVDTIKQAAQQFGSDSGL